jgi:hypothetical protein
MIVSSREILGIHLEIVLLLCVPEQRSREDLETIYLSRDKRGVRGVRSRFVWFIFIKEMLGRGI